MRRLAWVLVLGFVLSIPVWAGVGVWTPVGGMAPLYSRMVADPGDPRTLYALIQVNPAGSGNALWKSTDGGATWRSIQQGIGPVEMLAVDPLQPGRLYAWDDSDYAQPKLWASEDGGDTWTLRYAAVPNSSGPRFWQIVVSPMREGVLYGWTDSSTEPYGVDIYRSADGGATWTLRGSVGTSRVSFESLLHHPARNLLEYFDDSGFYTSRDNGLTWTVRSTFRGQGFGSVARSVAAPDRLYALPIQGSPCLLRSDDDGTHWKKTRSSPAFPRAVACTSVSVDPSDPDRVVLAAEGQLGRQYVHLFAISRDGGATWSQPRPFPASFVLATGDDSGTLYATGGNSFPAPGPYKSLDDGLTWTPSWDGITAGDFRAGLVALPAAGTVPVLVATVGGRLLRSEDGGATWEALVLPGAYLGVVADADGRTLYGLRRDADDRAFVVKSADGGLTWDEVSKVPYYFGGLRADPFQPGRLFAANDEFSGPERITVWRSTDGGKSWARRSAGLPTACRHIASVDICPDFYAITSDPRNPNRLVISFSDVGEHFSAEPEVFVSADGGGHWRRAAQGPPTFSFALAADPAVPGVFLAGTRQGIYRSVDGGEHWAPLKPGLPVAASVVQLLRDSRSGTWYAVTGDQGIFRSAGDGAAWTRISDGLADLAWPVAVLDPQAPDRLFAAVNGQGVWSWSPPGS
jgi:photosystem II stability/assembly factor-like uncharacterized protein